MIVSSLLLRKHETDTRDIAAYASFSNLTGSLTPGKRFDAVIWDDDLVSVGEDEMLDVRVKATIVDGQLAYGRIEQ